MPNDKRQMIRPKQAYQGPFTKPSNFNPQNTQSIPAVNPAKAGSSSLTLNKIEHFAKVSRSEASALYFCLPPATGFHFVQLA
jgi:hypothetical protein